MEGFGGPLSIAIFGYIWLMSHGVRFALGWTYCEQSEKLKDVLAYPGVSKAGWELELPSASLFLVGAWKIVPRTVQNSSPCHALARMDLLARQRLPEGNWTP